MECPYDKLTLQVAIISASGKIEKFVKEHGEDALADKLNALAPHAATGAVYNQLVADFHGISVETLVNSPNYSKLKEEHMVNLYQKAIGILETDVSLTNKEAWAVITAGQL